MTDNDATTLHEAGGVPELPECVGMQLMAISEEGDLRWMTARKVKAGDCLLYAMPGWGQAPSLFTAAQMHAYGAQCALAALAARPLSGGWVSVEERLPEFDMGSVLIAATTGLVQQTFFCADANYWGNSAGVFGKSAHFDLACRYGYEITHWQAMPSLPAPPAGTDEGGR